MELVVFAVIAVLFWLLLIRPTQRRQKEIAAVQASLAPGETVVLTSGIFGTIAETSDTHVMLEVAPGAVIKVARAAVGSVVREDGADEAAGAEATDTGTSSGADTGDDIDNDTGNDINHEER